MAEADRRDAWRRALRDLEPRQPPRELRAVVARECVPARRRRDRRGAARFGVRTASPSSRSRARAAPSTAAWRRAARSTPPVTPDHFAELHAALLIGLHETAPNARRRSERGREHDRAAVHDAAAGRRRVRPLIAELLAHERCRAPSSLRLHASGCRRLLRHARGSPSTAQVARTTRREHASPGWRTSRRSPATLMREIDRVASGIRRALPTLPDALQAHVSPIAPTPGFAGEFTVFTTSARRRAGPVFAYLADVGARQPAGAFRVRALRSRRDAAAGARVAARCAPSPLHMSRRMFARCRAATPTRRSSASSRRSSETMRELERFQPELITGYPTVVAGSRRRSWTGGCRSRRRWSRSAPRCWRGRRGAHPRGLGLAAVRRLRRRPRAPSWRRRRPRTSAARREDLLRARVGRRGRPPWRPASRPPATTSSTERSR